MMSVGTAFAYIMGICFLCSILGLVLINLCAVADFVINSRRGDVPYITDGLGMKAMTDNYSSGEIAVRAVKAGVDMFCCPANLKESVQALEEAVERGEISEERIDESVLRILQLKIDRGIIQ